jgi:hypothetical protein
VPRRYALPGDDAFVRRQAIGNPAGEVSTHTRVHICRIASGEWDTKSADSGPLPAPTQPATFCAASAVLMSTVDGWPRRNVCETPRVRILPHRDRAGAARHDGALESIH